jgi:UDP-glucose 4-epimerase
MTMNALIVGGAGFVGANLVRACLRDNARVTVLDSLDPRMRSTLDGLRDVLDRVRLIQADVRDVAATSDAVAGQDVIFNCAGQTSHPVSMADPIFDAELNCIGNLALLEAVRAKCPDAVVVYTSSSTVVGKAVSSPIDETHSELPLDIYSANKLAAEKYYRIYHTAHGLKTVVLRFANLFGPYGKGFAEFGFVNYFLHLGFTGSEIRLFGRGDQLRNLLYVEDACDAMLRAAKTALPYGEPLFVAHDDHVSVREIAQQIITTFGRGTLTHVDWPEDRRRIEVDDVQISSRRFRDATGWQPRFSIRDGLERTKAVMEAAR